MTVLSRYGSRTHVMGNPAAMPLWFNALCGMPLFVSNGWTEQDRDARDDICKSCARIEAARLTGDCEQDCLEHCRGLCGAS